MQKKSILVILSVLFLAIYFNGCKDNPTEPVTESTKQLTMAHFGVDWSEGKVATADGSVVITEPDGETIGWCPNGDQGGWGTGIWYRAFNDRIYRIGTGELKDVASVDTTKWSNDVCTTPLKNGDVWVAECRDGFVAFKVLDAPADSVALANDPMWEVKVEYKFSHGTKF